VCAVLSSVCATTVDNSGVYVHYLKDIKLCPYVLDARLGLRVSLEHAFTYVSTTNRAERRSSATHLSARWEHERTTPRSRLAKDESRCKSMCKVLP